MKLIINETVIRYALLRCLRTLIVLNGYFGFTSQL